MTETSERKEIELEVTRKLMKTGAVVAKPNGMNGKAPH